MKKDRKHQYGWRAASGIIVLLVALWLGLCAEPFSIVSRAESEAKVTVSSAKIRQEPNTSSTALASALKDAKLSIKGKLTGDDGNIWYQVYVDANKLGYVRSDLVEITDGSTPPTVSYTAGGNASDTGTGATQPEESVVEVTAVNPVSASVTGGQAVRVRQNASTTSRIVTTAKSGLVLTVTGTAVGTDGKEWYQVNFISNSSEVSGFIRCDYVEVSEELVPIAVDTPAMDPDDGFFVDTPTEPEPEVTKDWDTYYEGGKWHLINNLTGDPYDIDNIFKIAEDNKKVAEDALAAKKTQKIVIIILAILLVGAAALASFLIFRVKDMTDSAYFREVERETARRRTADRPQRSGQGQRPAGSGQGQRPAGSGQGQRPAGSGQGQRPAGSGQGQRPAGSGQGQRPAGSAQGQHPVGSAQGQRPAGSGQGQRPVGSGQGQRPVGSGQGQRPAGSGQGQRPAGSGQGQRPAGNGQRPGGSPDGRQEPSWRSKNFMSDDDDLECNFMDWDGDDNE